MTDREKKKMPPKPAAGDPAAFRELVEENRGRVLNTCYRFVHNHQDAEDLAQEVFIEVNRSLSRFRGEAKLSTWIYRIAVSKSLDFIRKKKRKKRLGTIKSLFGVGEEVEKAPAPARTRPDAELEREERLRVLQNALNSLPENQRIAITMSKYEGFSQQEIANVLGTTVSAVESLVHRAKGNLRKKLYRYYEKNSSESAGFSGR